MQDYHKKKRGDGYDLSIYVYTLLKKAQMSIEKLFFICMKL